MRLRHTEKRLWGWCCTRADDHDGPCALVPRWWNLRWRLVLRR